MKRICCILLAMLSMLTLFGCDSSIEVSGLDRFNENVCFIGTCDGLLPANSMFISNRPYEDGNFYWWTDGWYSQAKALVWLQYSEDIYLLKKSVSIDGYYDFSGTQYEYEGFVFSAPNIMYNATETSPSQGIQMCGYNDATCTFIFIGSYGYEFDGAEIKTQALFEDFFEEEFAGYLKVE